MAARTRRSGTSGRREREGQAGDGFESHISEAAEDHFNVADAKTGAVTTVVYAQVQQLKVNKYPHQLGIGLAAIGGIIGIALILAVALRGS